MGIVVKVVLFLCLKGEIDDGRSCQSHFVSIL